MWTYAQKTGEIKQDGVDRGVGYSGHGVGLNNPDFEAMVNVGPIPRGRWQIIKWEDHHGDKGPIVAILKPVGHTAHWRAGFLIHGDNSAGNHSASHGCIIAPRV